MVEKWVKSLAKARWFVVAFWIGLAAISMTMLPDLQEIVKRTETKFVPSDAESMRAMQLLERIEQGPKVKSNAVIVLQRKNGLSDADRQWLKSTMDRLEVDRASLQIVNITSAYTAPEFSEKFISPDGTTELAIIGLPKPENVTSTQETIDKLQKKLNDPPNGATLHLTGSAPISKQFMESSQEGLKKTELLTVVLVLGILLIVFRSPIAPFIPLLTIGISLVITRGLVAAAAEAGMPVSSFTEAFLIAVLFGAGTDYCILLIHRFREELSRTDNRVDALNRTIKTVGKTVLFSGSTVFIAFFLIGFAKFGLYQSAVGVSIGIAVTIAAGLTLTPALMMLLGKSMFWPVKIKEDHTHGESKLWKAMGNLVEKRPIAVLLVTLLLLSPIILLFQGNRSFDDIAEMNPDMGSVVGFRKVADKFSSGEVLPITITLTSSQSMRTPEGLAALETASAAAKQVGHVAEVRSATRPIGKPIKELSVPNQLEKANEGLSQIENGVKQVSDGLQQARNDIGEGASDIDKMQQGMSQMSEKTLEAQAGLKQIHTGMQRSQQGLAQVSKGISNSGVAADSMSADLNELAKRYPELANDASFQTLMFKQQSLFKGLAQIGKSIDPLYEGIRTMTPAAGGISDGLGMLAGHQKQAADGVQKLQNGFVTLDNGLGQGIDALQQAAKGLEQIGNAQRGIADNGNKQIAGWYLPQEVLETSGDLKKALDYYISPDGKTAKMEIVLSINPYSKQAMDTISTLRQTVKQSLNGSAIQHPQVLFSGTTAQYDELKQISQEDFMRTGAFVLVGIYLVLIWLLRSWIAPVYLLLSLLFNYLITMGIVEFIFVKLIGYPGLSWTVSFFVFLIIVALGVDYSIFLMARFKEEYRPGAIIPAMKKAMSTTGGVIMSAAVIMGGTFAALMSSGVDTLVQIGAGIVIGLVVYTTVIMGLVVPATAMLIGEANWLPSKKKRSKQAPTALTDENTGNSPIMET